MDLLPIPFDRIEEVASLLTLVAERTRSLGHSALATNEHSDTITPEERRAEEMVAQAIILRLRRQALDTLLHTYKIEVRVPPYRPIGVGRFP